MNTKRDIVLDAQLFALDGKKLEELNENQFKHESELQRMIEYNMSDMFGIDYIDSEVHVGRFRIDTVAFDRETKSFVIIEYKRDKSVSVVDQGTAYLTLLKENSDTFVLKYNKKFKCFLERKDFDWEQSRVMLIARTFNAHQKQAANKPDLRIELYEIKRYSRSAILLNPVHKVKKIPKKHTDVTKNRRDKTSEKNPNDVKKIYQEIENKITSLNKNIQVSVKKKYIAFKLQQNFIWIVLWKNSIDVTFAKQQRKINDPKKICEDVTDIGHFGGGDMRIKITNASEIPYLMTIIDQILEEVNM